MKRLWLALCLCLLWAVPSHAAIALDAATHGGFSVAASHTFSHTVGGGSDRILWVFAWGLTNAPQDITGVTYNGVAMTKAAEVVSTVDHRNASLWYLVAPASGANNVVITGTGGTTDACGGAAVSYTGASQTGVPDAIGTATVTSTTLSVSVTVVAANSWIVAGMRNSGGAITAGAGTTMRISNADGTNLADSGGTVSTGAQSLVGDDAGAGVMTFIAASFKPSAGGGGGGVKPIIGGGVF